MSDNGVHLEVYMGFSTVSTWGPGSLEPTNTTSLVYLESSIFQVLTWKYLDLNGKWIRILGFLVWIQVNPSTSK